MDALFGKPRVPTKSLREFEQHHDQTVKDALPRHTHRETLDACLAACLADHECAGVERAAVDSFVSAPCTTYTSVTHRAPTTAAPGQPSTVVYAVKSRARDPPLSGGEHFEALYATRNPRDGAMWCTNDFGDAALAHTAAAERLHVVRVCPSSHSECRRAAPDDKYGKCTVPGEDVA